MFNPCDYIILFGMSFHPEECSCSLLFLNFISQNGRRWMVLPVLGRLEFQWQKIRWILAYLNFCKFVAGLWSSHIWESFSVLQFGVNRSQFIVVLVRDSSQRYRSSISSPVVKFHDYIIIIRYEGPLSKLGQLKRQSLHSEWNFYFDCITRAFSSKCTNYFDALPIMSQQIGYPLMFD